MSAPRDADLSALREWESRPEWALWEELRQYCATTMGPATYATAYGMLSRLRSRLAATAAPRETAAAPAPDPCPKCGGGDHRVIFHNGSIDKGWRSRSCGFSDHNTESAEHLHHYCQTCHYDWAARLSGESD